MTRHTTTNLVISSSLALVLALAFGSPVQAQSVQPAEGTTMTEAKMMKDCQEMKEQKERMKKDMKAQDARLTERLATMNRAPEDKKVDLMAALLTNMVEQRIAMDARKAKMEDEMMKHMMQHMQMGKDSLSECPVMMDTKDMKDMDKK